MLVSNGTAIYWGTGTSGSNTYVPSVGDDDEEKKKEKHEAEDEGDEGAKSSFPPPSSPLTKTVSMRCGSALCRTSTTTNT